LAHFTVWVFGSSSMEAPVICFVVSQRLYHARKKRKHGVNGLYQRCLSGTPKAGKHSGRY
jgi:hypothetical protein